MPDGIETVTAAGSQGERRTLDVSGNVAFADLSDSARLEFTDGDGKHAVNAPGTPEALSPRLERVQAPSAAQRAQLPGGEVLRVVRTALVADHPCGSRCA